MKHVSLITLLLFAVFSFGQEHTETQKEEVKPESKKVFSLGFSTGYKFFLGDNFLAETYKNKLPLYIDARLNLKKNIGFGVYYSYNNATIKTTKFVGDSAEGNFKEWGFYGAYFLKINNEITIVPRIGISTFLLKNKLRDESINRSYDYYTEGTTYFIAPEINYFFAPEISLFLNVQYNYISMPDVRASSISGTNYNSSNELFLGFGLNVWL